MKKFEILLKCDTATQMSKCLWENGANRRVQQKVAADLQSVKHAMPAKCNKATCSNMRHACNIVMIDFLLEVEKNMNELKA